MSPSKSVASSTPHFLYEVTAPLLMCLEYASYKGVEGQLFVPHIFEDEKAGNHLALWMHFNFIEVAPKIKN